MASSKAVTHFLATALGAVLFLGLHAVWTTIAHPSTIAAETITCLDRDGDRPLAQAIITGPDGQKLLTDECGQIAAPRRWCADGTQLYVAFEGRVVPVRVRRSGSAGQVEPIYVGLQPHDPCPLCKK